MTGIDPTGKLSALIRAQAAALQQQNKSGDSKRTVKESKSARAGPDDWMAQVTSAVASIGADDPQRRRKAFRIYLSSALSRELGIDQVSGSEFQHLLDKVQEVMVADADLNKAIDQAGDMLLQQATAKT